MDMNVAAVIPSLNPDAHFTGVVDDLIKAGFKRVYIVNDGSDSSFDGYFEHAAGYPECVLLAHPENRGKGRALKTAFARHLAEPCGCVGVVTLDGDGQHCVEDVVAVAKALAQKPDDLILGARDFAQGGVPAKSALGNRITRRILSALCGARITDTQTGLRGVPNRFMERLLHISGDRYEFETNMLLEARRARVAISEVPIRTIYTDHNLGSHFRPFVDSVRIYALILGPLGKFPFASMLSALVDLSLFNLFNRLLAALVPALRLFLATALARICSAVFNFFVNHRLVFKSRAGYGGAMLRYFSLCAAQMMCSYGGVYLFSEILPLPVLPAKIVTDVSLFFISFFIQHRWVFRTGSQLPEGRGQCRKP
ncbi:MAG: bifunctional glycosyltransferase family 2/GtrA family protein [Clostridiales Family XIII bacterium]|jgi:putative flippase GtrA|nr:bifunctional glycosyltransferase family 2/GtrA family protein [Clostridiales Family XIII bacterium]